MSATSRCTESAIHSIAGSDFLWRLCVSAFQAQRNPLPEVMEIRCNHCCGETRLRHMHCGARQGLQIGRTTTNEMRCANHVRRNRRRSRIQSSGRRLQACKPGDRPSWHGASAACTCHQMRSKPDSANRSNLHDSLRTQHGPTVAQSSNLS